MRTIGLDVGDRRIGVAVSDPEGRLAVPLRVLDRRSGAGARSIGELARTEEAERIVVGMPVSLDGSTGAQAVSVEEFVAELRRATEIDVVTYDERLSSAEADRHLDAMGLRGQQRKDRRDAVAAAIILQAYLDSLRFPPLPPVE